VVVPVRCGNGGGRGNSGSRGRGAGRGGRGSAHQSPADNEDNHANVENHKQDHEDQDVGGATNNSTNNNAYFDASFNIYNVEQLVLMHGLPLMWLLMDSCSTTDIFAMASLLSNTHTAAKPIWVHCNAGCIQLTQHGYFGNYPHPVWYNPKGVANILSLANVTKHYRVTMDSAASPAMLVHKNDGTSIKFEPSGSGLYKHELPSDNTAINQMWSMLSSISTVAENASNYTKRAYKRAVEARRLQNIIMQPPSRKYKEVILDCLRDSKVTRADIDAAENIFGPNLGSIKGKTVRRPNEHVASGIDAVPNDVLTLHQHVTLTIDIKFVNKIPFCVTKSRGLQFTTVEALPNRRVSTINSVLTTALWAALQVPRVYC